MEEDSTFFVLAADAHQVGGGPVSFEYALVQIARDKIERALWMQDGIDGLNEKISELKEQEEQNFGSEVRDEILKLDAKISKMQLERNDYIGSNAISYVRIIEHGQQTFFEGDGIPASALKRMLEQKLLEIGAQDEDLMRV